MEEGHYTIKRVSKLPKKGNSNWLYIITKDRIEEFHRWIGVDGGYETIMLGSKETTNIEEGDNITITGTGTSEDPLIINSADTFTPTDLPTDYGITLSTVATTNNYNDLDNKPVFKVVENEYTTMTELYADQINQTSTFIQYVLDASSHSGITSGAAYFEYLGTTFGDDSDYRLLSEEESAPISSSITKTSELVNDGATGLSPYAEVKDLISNADDIIEGNTNKLLTVFERAKLDDITFDGNTINTFLGIGAGDISTGGNITATGFNAARNTTGSNITATGRAAAANSTGSNIIATGLSAAADTNGNQIVALGVEAARYSSGSNTVAVGNISGRNAIGNSITSIGYGAGTFPFSNTLQTPNSTAIGANTIIDKANQAAIGDAAVTELKIGETLVIDKNQIVTGAEGFLVTKKLGGKTVAEVSNNFGSQSVSFAGNVGIGTTNPSYKLDVSGTGRFTGAVITGVYTVSTLPTGEKGSRAFVSDANSSTFNTVAVGGGTNNVPVFHDGTTWRIG